jgi:HEPN domain-containing protein
MFWHVATQDYVAARCCISNAIFSGFAIAAQAVEKYLKAFLLYEGEKRLGQHDLRALLARGAQNSVDSQSSVLLE